MSKRARVITGVGVVVLAVLVISVVVWLVTSGRLIIAWGDGSRDSAAATRVCTTDIVDTYNEAMFYELRDGSTEPTLDEEGLAGLATEIRGKDGYGQDATCQTILFWIAVTDGDHDTARTAQEKLTELHEEGVFADNNLRTNSPLFLFEDAVRGLDPSRYEQPEELNAGDPTDES